MTETGVIPTKLVYHNEKHLYFLDGRRAKAVSNVAKIPDDTYNLECWDRRQVAIGLAMDRNLVENIALDIEDRDALDNIVDQAKRVAKAHRAADRGTQMHRVLQLVLLEQEHKLLTDQQRADAELLKRTLDRYKLTPYDGMAEQFIVWPHYTVAGRFDAILERPDGTLILADLKSGPNAIEYPRSTICQLSLYAHAPQMSAAITTTGDKSEVTQWRTMPTRLERRYAYVMLAQPDSDIGTLHELDIEHGWAAARLALEIVNWRKHHDYGRSAVRGVMIPPSLIEQARDALSVGALRALWDEARAAGELTPDFQAVATARARALSGQPAPCS